MSTYILNETMHTNHNPFYAGLTTLFDEYGITIWYSIHLTAMFVILLSCIGSSYIIVLSCVQGSLIPLRTIQYFPLCISITDLIFGLFHGIDHLISVTGRKVMDGNMCKIFGFGTVWAMNAPSFWVPATALYVYFIICHNKKIDFGTNDWILHLICWGGPSLIGIIALGMDRYGSEMMWCGIPDGIFFFNGIPVLIGLIISVVCYSFTWFRIRDVMAQKMEVTKIQLRHGNVVQPTATDKHLQESARQMPIFVAIYVFQWVTYIIYAILWYRGIASWQYDNFVVIATNSGGIFNAIAYRKMLLAKKKESVSQTNTFMEGKLGSSLSKSDVSKHSTGSQSHSNNGSNIPRDGIP